MIGSGVELVQCSRSGRVGWGQHVPPPQVSLFGSEAALKAELLQFLVIIPEAGVDLILQVIPEDLLLVDLEVIGEGVGHGVNPSGTKVLWHGVGGLGNPPCASSGGDLHPLLLVAVDHHGSAAQFDAPVESNVHGMCFAGEELGVVHAGALGGGAPGSEGHRVACELESV